MFQIDGPPIVVHFMNKKSLLPVTELDKESAKLVEMVGQQILVGLTHLNSDRPKVKAESKRMVEKVLPELAPALYRGMTIATIDYAKAGEILHQMRKTEKDLPLIYATDIVN